MGKPELTQVDDLWYKVLFDANPLPMLVYDRKTFCFLDVNQSAIEHYGYSREEWLNMSVEDLHVEEDVEGALKEVHSAPEAAFHRAGIWRHLKKDGTKIHVDILRYLIPCRGKNAALVMVHDVSTQCDMEDTLRRAESDLNQAQEIARLGSWVWDMTTEEARWSDQEFRNFGYEPQAFVPSHGFFVDRIVHPDDRDMMAERIDESIRTGQLFYVDHRVIWPDGSVHEMRERGVTQYDENGKPVRFFGTTLDVTDLRCMERELRKTQKDLEKAQQIAHIGTWVWDVKNDSYEAWSDETYRILGIDRNSLPANSGAFEQLLRPDDRATVQQARNKALEEPDTRFEVEYRIIHPNGNMHIVHATAEVLVDAEGKPSRMLGIMQDVTEQRAAEEKIRRLAYYDEATGLPNRVHLRQELDQRLVACRNEGRPLALLIVDLIRFRDINYTLGHVNGDRLLKEVAERIQKAMTGAALTARIGNAQFAVVLSDAGAYEATIGMRHILDALQAPFPVAGIAYELGAYIGLALAPGHGSDVDTILRKADVALYQAKQSGQTYAIYQVAQDPYKPQRLALMGEFRKAIQSGELQLYCQPKANIRTGQITGAEALVRWQHPKFGLVAPDRFIPLIEPTDQIHLLTKFMLQAALSQCYAWHQQGCCIPLAVNLSPRNLIEPDLADNLKYLLLTWGADADWLGLEITESSLVNDSVATIEELTRLSKMGFRLFIDDFGTGYSSLSYLMRLPVNVIKIDHAFTMRMIKDKGAAAIVKSTIELAHNLGMSVVAEGTADRQIWEALSALGCDEAQGYYISPPIPAQNFMPWLQASGFDFLKESSRTAH